MLCSSTLGEGCSSCFNSGWAMRSAIWSLALEWSWGVSQRPAPGTVDVPPPLTLFDFCDAIMPRLRSALTLDV